MKWAIIFIAAVLAMPASAIAQSRCDSVLRDRTLERRFDMSTAITYLRQENVNRYDEIHNKEGLKVIYGKFGLDYNSSTDRQHMLSISRRAEGSFFNQQKYSIYTNGVGEDQVEAWLKCTLEGSSPDWRVSDFQFNRNRLVGVFQYTSTQPGIGEVNYTGFSSSGAIFNVSNLTPGAEYRFNIPISNNYYGEELRIDITNVTTSRIMTIKIKNPQHPEKIILCKKTQRNRLRIGDLSPGSPSKRICVDAGSNNFFRKESNVRNYVQRNVGSCTDSDCQYINYEPTRICGNFQSVAGGTWSRDDFFGSNIYHFMRVRAFNERSASCPAGFERIN